MGIKSSRNSGRGERAAPWLWGQAVWHRSHPQTVGLALVTKLAAALCRDAGEGSLAAFVEVAGAAAAVLVALPLLKMVLQLVMGLL